MFGVGDQQARLMIVGEAPGRDEDREGHPFVGRAGQLLDRMFAAIGLGRTTERPEDGIYITNVLPWRPPQIRDPKPEEIAMIYSGRDADMYWTPIMLTKRSDTTETEKR